MFQGSHSKSFVITLALLPTLVQVVMMMVNGNLGTGVAVMGAFSLVRFRSVPGSSKEILAIFFAMAIGLATGMGYISFAAVVTIVIGAVLLVLGKSRFGEEKGSEHDLRICIPESLDYNEVFDDILKKYTKKTELVKVKTTNMGSMYELTYRIVMEDPKAEKSMIDDIRCRNGNLSVMNAKAQTVRDEL